MNEIVEWLKNYSQNSNLSTFVIGISGGIDSALTSTLCAETGINTIVVSMPIHQQKSELDRAHEHIKWLKDNYKNVTSMEVNLSHVYDTFEMMFADNENKLALANSRARLRMTTLYQIAQTNNGLVVGTGNKVEDFGVGFFTKYGDGGVDISPIADLMKSEVREMARTLGISTEILNAAPTDGLWGDERTDEDQLGATYDELEWAMNYTESEYAYSREGYHCTDRQEEVLKIYNRFNKQNKHKMRPIPVFIKKEK
jgi:NAD+ synthase